MYSPETDEGTGGGGGIRIFLRSKMEGWGEDGIVRLCEVDTLLVW